MQGHPTLCDPMDYIARQAPLSMKISRQEYLSTLPFSTPGDLLDPWIETASPLSPELACGFFTTLPPEKPVTYFNTCKVTSVLTLSPVC